VGGAILLILNTSSTPIANKYCEGKMKSTANAEVREHEIDYGEPKIGSCRGRGVDHRWLRPVCTRLLTSRRGHCQLCPRNGVGEGSASRCFDGAGELIDPAVLTWMGDVAEQTRGCPRKLGRASVLQCACGLVVECFVIVQPCTCVRLWATLLPLSENSYFRLVLEHDLRSVTCWREFGWKTPELEMKVT